MKKLLLAAVSSILLMASCTQQNTPSPNNNNNGGGTSVYNVDQSYFFKINFQNKALYNYGVFSTLSPGCLGGPQTPLLSTTTSNGVLSTEFWMGTSGENMYVTNANCKATFILYKSGNATGVYTKSSVGQIIDLTTAKNYNIDTTTLNVNVTAVGVHNVTGTITCKLIDGTTLIPATGSFNIYKP
jgi:hypothetical protein